MRVESLALSEWDAVLPETGIEVFHKSEALRVLSDHVRGELRLLGGFKGEQPIALLPVFVQRRAIGTLVLSPPPGMGVPRLGPILMSDSPKQRKREKLNREFTREALEFLEANAPSRAADERTGFDSGLTTQLLDRLDVQSPFTIYRIICHPEYPDPRPFLWDEFTIRPSFTYRHPIDSPSEEILGSFSRSLRREIRDASELDLTVEPEGLDGAREIYRDTRRRYAEQDEPYDLDWAYVEDLVTALSDHARAYVARNDDGEYVGGITVLYSSDAAYFWQGGSRAIYEGVGINSLIHWRIIEDVADGDVPEETITAYDLMGANTERLCRYKSKFGADLVPYYVVESDGLGMAVAKKAYRLVEKGGRVSASFVGRG